MPTNTPVLTAGTNPIPNVKIVVSGLLAAEKFIRIWRNCDGETELVRGAVFAPCSGSFTIVDYDAPIGRLATYTAEGYADSNGTGPQGISSPATITLTSTSIWVHDPIAPLVNAEIQLTGTGDLVLGKGSFAKVQRGYDVVRTQVLGRNKPIVQFYGQKAIQNLEFELITSEIGTNKAAALLATAPLMFRFPPSMKNLPSRISATLDAYQEPVTWHYESSPITTWKLVLNEVEAQSLAILFAVFPYSYWSARYATYSAASAVYGSGTYQYAIDNPPA